MFEGIQINLVECAEENPELNISLVGGGRGNRRVDKVEEEKIEKVDKSLKTFQVLM